MQMHVKVADVFYAYDAGDETFREVEGSGGNFVSGGRTLSARTTVSILATMRRRFGGGPYVELSGGDPATPGSVVEGVPRQGHLYIIPPHDLRTVGARPWDDPAAHE
jgi:hypothetical protein